MEHRQPWIVGSLLACAVLAPAAEARQVWLDELDLTLSSCGWQQTVARQSVGGNPLRLSGRSYERGVGTHPPGAIWLSLDGRAERLHAVCGVDDEVGSQGSIEFRVVGDQKLLWSRTLRGGEPSVGCEVDLAGVRRLTLEVGTTPDGYGNDHADWADAWIETGGEVTAVPEPPSTPWDEIEREIGFFRSAGPESRFVREALDREATVLPEDRDPLDVLLRRTRALLACLRPMEGAPDLAAEAELLLDSSRRADRVAPGQEARRALFEEADALRRRIALRNPLLDFDRVLFLKRDFHGETEFEGNHMCDQFFGFTSTPGGGLFVLEDPFGPSPRARDLLDGATLDAGRLAGRALLGGGFLAPELSFDGREVLFAWTEGERSPYLWSERSTYHLFRVGADGIGLRQLTDGPWNDFDPCWLPDGRVAFISERRGGYGRCHGRPVPTYTLHTMLADGSDIRCISPHETNEWQPSVDRDGMLVYTRWDYVDRGFNQAHHPWLTTPDGCDPRAIQGNFAERMDARPQMEMDVRAVPGSRKLVATATAHHGQSYGPLVLLDPAVPDDDAMGPVRRITPDTPFPECEQDSRQGQRYATAWPLEERFYLCVYDPDATGARGARNRYGIYLVDAFGNRIPLYRDPAISCLSPIPLRPRPLPPVVPERTRGAVAPAVLRPSERSAPRPSGLVGVLNVRESLLPLPTEAVVSALRIVEVLPKTTPNADDPRIGYGRQKGARRVLGTVPVESDGSAWFSLPAGVPVYFQALDGEGMAVQSMRSETWVQPGQTLMCQGCHNPRASAPPAAAGVPLALRRGPSTISPEVGGSSPFSYPRLVQPVLDRSCVGCHASTSGAPDLSSGDWEADPSHWYASYRSLQPWAFYFDDPAWTTPRTIPGHFGARASRLLALLEEGHHGVSLAPEDLRRLTLWLDSNSDFFGAYTRTREQAAGEIVEPELE